MVFSRIKELLAKGECANNICVIVNRRDYINDIVSVLNDEKFQFYEVVEKYDPKPDEIIISSRHASKGLEFKHVIICGLEEDKDVSYHKSTFVAMTRAKYSLMIVYREDQNFSTINAIKDVYEKMKEQNKNNQNYENQLRLYENELNKKIIALYDIHKVAMGLNKDIGDNKSLTIIKELIKNALFFNKKFNNSISDKKMNQDNQEIDKLIEENKDLKQKCDNLNQKLKDKINKVKSEIKENNKKIKDLKNDLKEKISENDNIKRDKKEISNKLNKYKMKTRVMGLFLLILVFLFVKFNLSEVNFAISNSIIKTSEPEEKDLSVKSNHFKSEMKYGQIKNENGMLLDVKHSYITINIDGEQVNELTGYHQYKSTVSINENNNNAELIFNGVIGKYGSKQSRTYDNNRVSINQSVKIVYSNSYNSVSIDDKTYELAELKELMEYIDGIEDITVYKENDQIVIEYKR